MSASPAVTWFFRDRRTGEVTVVQPPNVWAASSMALLVAGLVLHGRPARAARIARTGTSIVWGAGELTSGVNPWRRSLGVAALAFQGARLIRRSTRP